MDVDFIFMKFNIYLVALLFALITCDATVKEIKGLTTKQLVFSGNLSISDTSSSQLFFTYYGTQGVTDRAQLSKNPTLVVFSNSSQYLNLGSMGPLLLQPNLTLTANPDSPTTVANIMFVDHLGAGFSFAADPKEIVDSYPALAAQITYALKQFQSQIDFGSGKLVLVGESSWIRLLSGLSGVSNVVGVVSIGSWVELYANGRYAGTSGIELGIFDDLIRSEVQNSFINCYLLIKGGQYQAAHTCYDNTLNLVEDKTKNRNLFNVKLNSTLIGLFPQVQYYFQQSATQTIYSAPTSAVFESQANTFQTRVFTDIAKNYTQNISQYLTSNTKIKLLLLGGTLDYIAYNKAIRNWAENQLSFPESSTFRPLNLTDIQTNGTTVARTKSVNQVTYVQVLSAGHYTYADQPKVVAPLLINWISTLGNGNIRMQDQ